VGGSVEGGSAALVVGDGDPEEFGAVEWGGCVQASSTAMVAAIAAIRCAVVFGGLVDGADDVGGSPASSGPGSKITHRSCQIAHALTVSHDTHLDATSSRSGSSQAGEGSWTELNASRSPGALGDFSGDKPCYRVHVENRRVWVTDRAENLCVDEISRSRRECSLDHARCHHPVLRRQR